jgi:hypothetical protein
MADQIKSVISKYQQFRMERPFIPPSSFGREMLVWDTAGTAWNHKFSITHITIYLSVLMSYSAPQLLSGECARVAQ